MSRLASQAVVGFFVGCGISGATSYIMKQDRPEATSRTTSWNETQSMNNSISTNTGGWNENWDRSHIKHRWLSLSQPAPDVKRHFYLVRHGKYNTKAKEADDKILTELGVDQAKMTGKYLESLEPSFDSILSSGMIRARQTAEHLNSNLGRKRFGKIPTDPGLNECTMYPIVPRSKTSHYASVDAYNTIEAAIEKHFSRPTTNKTTHELIICHANVIRYIVCRLLQVPAERWSRISLPHGSVTKISIDRDGYVEVTAIGESGYIPSSMLTRS